MTTITPTRNGVDVQTYRATIDAVRGAPEAARFQFRAHNTWIDGTHTRTRIEDFFGVGEERSHDHAFTFDSDHPGVLVGADHGPTGPEFVLHALAACLTSGLVNIAAARGVTLTSVQSTVTGDIDLNGILGLDPAVRNGFSAVRVDFQLVGDADAATLRDLVERAQRRSAVLDLLVNGVQVEVGAAVGRST